MANHSDSFNPIRYQKVGHVTMCPFLFLVWSIRFESIFTDLPVQYHRQEGSTFSSTIIPTVI